MKGRFNQLIKAPYLTNSLFMGRSNPTESTFFFLSSFSFLLFFLHPEEGRGQERELYILEEIKDSIHDLLLIIKNTQQLAANCNPKRNFSPQWWAQIPSKHEEDDNMKKQIARLLLAFPFFPHSANWLAHQVFWKDRILEEIKDSIHELVLTKKTELGACRQLQSQEQSSHHNGWPEFQAILKELEQKKQIALMPLAFPSSFFSTHWLVQLVRKHKSRRHANPNPNSKLCWRLSGSYSII